MVEMTTGGARAVMMAAALVTVVGCTKNPATGKRQLNFVGKGQEVSLGREGAEQVVASVGVYEDDELNRYVATVGAKLAAVSERKDLPWSFRVVDDPSVNAFALPGGYIFVTRGLLAHLDNEAQLAAVLGHEIGHVTGQHSVNQLSKAQLAQLGLGLGMVFSDTVREFGQVGMQGLQLMFLKFGRDDEREADMLGVRYAQKAGYDLGETPKVFEVLGRVGAAAGAGRLPGWMATHPDPAERAEDARERLTKINAPGGAVNDQHYLQRIDGMIYGPNPREGFFQGDRFVHPTLQFSFDLPQGWQKQNFKQAVLAQPPQKNALVQLTVTPKNVGPENALRAFFSQQGVRQIAPTRKVDGTGLGAQFVAPTQEGELGGFVAFYAHGDATYQMVAATTPQGLSVYATAFEQVANSFSRVEDPRILAVQPVRLRLERADKSASLAALVQERPSSIPVEQLALINQIHPSTVVAQGETLKWAVGGTPPSVDIGRR